MANAVGSEPGLGLDRRRIGHSALPRSTLSVAGDRGIDQARVARGQGLVVQSEETERSGPEVLDNHIGRVAQAKRQRAGARHVQIDADIALAGILLRVVARHALRRRKRETREDRKSTRLNSSHVKISY